MTTIQALKLQIKTPHYERTITYYQRVLQAQVVNSWSTAESSGTVLSIDSLQQKVFLEIFQSDRIHNYEAFSIQFCVPSLNDYMLGLPAEYLSGRPIRRDWGSTYLHLTDPNGARVTIYQQG